MEPSGKVYWSRGSEQLPARILTYVKNSRRIWIAYQRDGRVHITIVDSEQLISRTDNCLPLDMRSAEFLIALKG